MFFWIAIALLTMAASIAVIVPLSRRHGDVAAASSHDIEVYRDQLAEIERDAARGLIGESEAEQARAEIGRRILRAAAGEAERGRAERATLARVASVVAILSIPVLSWGLYAVLGSPDLPGQPLAARLQKNPAESTVEELVSRAESHLRENPADGRGWDVLAPIYLRMNRPQDAVTAYRNAIRLLEPSAQRQAGLGEAMTASSGGIVTAEAVAAFEGAVALDPDNAKARFFLATALAQEGRMDEAAAGWRALAGDLPAGSPWREVVATALRQAETQALPGMQDMEAAARMNPEDRAAMIEGMVAGLDERLRENPQDAEGWRRLVRSYVVLDRPDDARSALRRGMAALGEGSAQATALREFALELGVEARK